MTDKILPQIEDWQNRPLDEVYPILYIDAIHYSVRDNGVIRKLAAYVILGINTEGKKEVLTITIGDNESAKYWLSVLNELKNRGVKDILIICADGLTGIKEAIATAFPKTEYQRCIVHQVRNTLKYVPDKDRKAFATDLKTIYQAADEQKALAALERVTEKWTPKYPNSMKRWKDNWDAVSPIFRSITACSFFSWGNFTIAPPEMQYFLRLGNASLSQRLKVDLLGYPNALIVTMILSPCS